MQTLAGSVDRIVFRNSDSGFCVARFHLAEGGITPNGTTTIVGTMPSIRPGEMLRVTGEWHLHPVHGRNFRVEQYEEEMPDTVDGIERYLSSGAVQGIGPVTAARIVDIFGERALTIMDEEPELLRSVPGISAKRLDVIRTSWNEQQRIRELAMFLQEQGVSVALARRIFESYGDRARQVIESDPYRLAHEVHGIGFITADGLAQRLGLSRTSASRYIAGLKFALSEATEDGHVYLDRHELTRKAGKILGAPATELEAALLELLQREQAVLEGDRVYLSAFHTAETGVARMLQRLRRTPSALSLDRRFDPSKAMSRAAEQQGLALAPGQMSAAETALREKVSVLTGGPGTGKTSTLRTIITALEGEDVSFCLCAPTGRAAKRVAETTGRAASTIHRLLEYQPATGLFAYDQHRPLPYDFVVVDEVSMLDILLFYHLLKAVAAEAHLLLVGDADQLPAVGPGRVLGDLIASEAIPTTTLTELFRQARGSHIVLAAHAVNRGEIPEAANHPSGDFFFVATETPEATLSAMKRLIAERIPAAFGFDPVDDVQVVAPMHNGPVGVISLNRELQELLNPAANGHEEIAHGGRIFRRGDKVMQVRNNYERDVYNGDVGRVLRVSPGESTLQVTFPAFGGPIEVEYGTSELDELTLAYAASVHKAQGSEFPCIIMPLVTSHYVLLRRNLLYTAITRARHLCVLVGSKKALGVAVAEQRVDTRNSGLADRLRLVPQSLELEFEKEPA